METGERRRRQAQRRHDRHRRVNAPRINLKVALPAGATAPVPVILLVQFGGGGAPVPDPPLAAEILARGWGYATVGYNDIQPDKADAFDQGVVGATRGQAAGRRRVGRRRARGPGA